MANASNNSLHLPLLRKEAMVFFTCGDVIFSPWRCHPGFAVSKIQLHPGFLARDHSLTS